MGIEDYEFLTRTMEEISELSTKLANEREEFAELKDEIKSAKDGVRTTEGKISEAEGEIVSGDLTFRTTQLNIIRMKKQIRDVDSKVSSIRENSPRSTLAPWINITSLYREDQEINGWTKLLLMGVIIVILAMVIGPESGYWGFDCGDGEYTLYIDIDDGIVDCSNGFDESTSNDAYAIWWFAEVIFIIGILFGYPTLAVRMDRSKVIAMKEEISSIKSEKGKSEKHLSDFQRIKKLFEQVDRDRQSVEESEEWLETATTRISDMLKEIKRVEEDIAALWDSIAHLIPYSSALEKA